MKTEKIEEIRKVISLSLDEAETNWSEVGHKLHIEKALTLDSISIIEARQEPSKIPGHQFVSDGIPIVEEFIALVVDMRNSTEHLKSERNNIRIENGFQRVYYETTALLSAVSTAVSFENGRVTEYLGDGALALFSADADRKQAIYDAYHAAENCISIVRQCINDEILNRYNLPQINLGVGLSISQAMVTLVGDEKNKQPKVIGQCVWEATKLSGGVNCIYVSEALRAVWPTSTPGSLSFSTITGRSDINGFRVKKKAY
jgi:hypothetical protein